MIIDTDIKIGNRRTAVVHNRPRPTMQNLSGEAIRQHEQVVEYRQRVNALSADLSSAVQALSAANEEISRLNCALDEAQQTNKALQDALDAYVKKSSVKDKVKKGKRSRSEPESMGTADSSDISGFV